MTESLITDAEAEEIVSLPGAVARKMRLPLLVVLGGLMVMIATLLILIVISLGDSRTGWESILPFLNSQGSSQGLQTN